MSNSGNFRSKLGMKLVMGLDSIVESLSIIYNTTQSYSYVLAPNYYIT